MAVDLTTMDATKPDGATEQVAVLDNYLREVRANLKDWANIEHGLTGGRHKFAVGNTASRPATGLETGTIYINTQTGAIEYWDGAAWQTATVIDAILNSLIDAKGDIIVGTANDTPARKAVGTVDGQFLIVDSGQADGLKWGTVTPRGYLYGMEISNNGADATNDIDIAAGECASDDAGVNDRVLLAPGAMTKQLDATWVAGTGVGGRIATEGLANGTWYVYAFRRSGGSDDICFSQSLTPTLPDGGTNKRRIHSFTRVGGSNTLFVQRGDEIWLLTPVLDILQADPGTAAVTRVLASIPTGVIVQAIVNVSLYGANNAESHVYLSDLATTDIAATAVLSAALVAPGATVGITGSGGVANGVSAEARVWTDVSSQIRSRCNGNIDADNYLGIVVLGWLDRRERF